jgi:hypothetical protein
MDRHKTNCFYSTCYNVSRVSPFKTLLKQATNLLKFKVAPCTLGAPLLKAISRVFNERVSCGDGVLISHFLKPPVPWKKTENYEGNLCLISCWRAEEERTYFIIIHHPSRASLTEKNKANRKYRINFDKSFKFGEPCATPLGANEIPCNHCVRFNVRCTTVTDKSLPWTKRRDNQLNYFVPISEN